MRTHTLVSFGFAVVAIVGLGQTRAAEVQMSSPGDSGSSGNRGCLETVGGGAAIPSVASPVATTAKSTAVEDRPYLRAAGGGADSSASAHSTRAPTAPTTARENSATGDAAGESPVTAASAIVERIPPHRWQSLVPGAIK